MASLYLSLFVMLCLGEQLSVPLSERLRSLDDEDWHVRERATDALIALGPSALPAIRSALEVEEDPEVRARLGIIERTIVLREHLAFSPTFLERYPDIHRDLARWEGRGEVFRFFKELTMLCSTDPAVTTADIAAMVGLLIGDGGQDLGEQEVRYVILTCMGKSSVGYFNLFRENIVWEKPVKEAASILIHLHMSPMLSVNNKEIIAWTLSCLEVKEIARDVLPLLSSSEKSIRDSAVEILGNLNVSDIAPAVVKLFTHADAGVRVSALNLLGLLPTKEYNGEIAACLDDSDPAVRGMAARTLAEKGEYDPIRRHPNFFQIVDDITRVDFIFVGWDEDWESRKKRPLVPLGIVPETEWPSNPKGASWGGTFD